MGPIICLVSPPAPEPSDLAERASAAARAGAHLVQVRVPGLDDRALLALVGRCLEALRGTRTRVVVNDRLDVALAAGAHGVHLRSDSVPPARVRPVVPPGFLVGRSVHGLDEIVRVTEAGGVDYFIFGTVFPSASKPGVAPAGLDTLARAASATPIPVLAIGGVTVSNLPGVARAGAAGFAAISMFADGDPGELPVAVREARAAFGRGVGIE